MSMDYNFEPRSQSDRMYAAFRQGKDRRHTSLAVTGPEGEAVTLSLEDVMGEILLELRAIRLGMELMTETQLYGEQT